MDGKEHVTIYDYVDITLPTLQRMFKHRVKGYGAMDYTIADIPEQALVQVSMPLSEIRYVQQAEPSANIISTLGV